MIIGLIPARLESKRLPGKALLNIDKLPLIIHTLKRAQLSKQINKIIVCTDSEKIANIVKAYNGSVLMTKNTHVNGTERIAEVAKKIKCELVIDIQCDEVLLEPKSLDKLVKFHKKNNDYDIVVPYSQLKYKTDINTVKIVHNYKNKILYMSRKNLPYTKNKKIIYSRHLDTISFNPKALQNLAKLPRSRNEMLEGVELNRALDNNFKVGTFLIKTKSFSVNTLADFKKAELFLKKCIIRRKY
jgi:3-deoxy-manno-octulosonate cytidylyltransferase (CMP-KDO synthetase)